MNLDLGQVTNASFADYKIPCINDLLSFLRMKLFRPIKQMRLMAQKVLVKAQHLVFHQLLQMRLMMRLGFVFLNFQLLAKQSYLDCNSN
jgi:hypothetical protein